MTLSDIQNIQTEMVVAVRNGNVLSASERGVVNFSGGCASAGGETEFFLGAAGSPLKNVRGIWVSGTGNLKDGIDYTVNYFSSGTNDNITFAVAPPIGASGIWRADYDYGPSDKIYGDYPRLDLNLTSYPRVSVCVNRVDSQPLGIGFTHLVTDAIVEITGYAQTVSGLNDITDRARQQLATSGTKLYQVNCVCPSNVSPIGAESGRNEKILVRRAEYRVIKQVEQI